MGTHDDLTFEQWKEQGLRLRESMEAERDALRHRLDMVTASLVDLDRMYGRAPSAPPRERLERIAPTIVKRRNRSAKSKTIRDHMIDVLRGSGGELSRHELVEELKRRSGHSDATVQSSISQASKEGHVDVSGPKGRMVVKLRHSV